MTETEYGRAYWKYTDEQEEILLKKIRGLGLRRRLQRVFDHFKGIRLSDRLPVPEVVDLHERIDKWLENVLPVREYRLLLRDVRGRRTITEKEALFVWFLAEFGEWYEDVLQVSEPVMLRVATERHYTALEQAKKATGKKTHSRTPTPQYVEKLMNSANPTFGRTVQQQLAIEAQYHANQFTAQFAAAELSGAAPKLDSAKIDRIERKVIARSDRTKTEPIGHHGIIDQQLTYIVGYTVLQAFEDAGVKKYKFIAVIDNKTTHACRYLNGKIFDIKDAKLGVNVPPISIDMDGLPIPHPCRSMIRVEE